MSRMDSKWLSPKSALLFFVLCLLAWPLAALAEEPVPVTPTVANEEEAALSPISRQVSALNTEIMFPATEDAYVAFGQPNENFGDADALYLGYSQGEEQYKAVRTLLHFDNVVDLIPEGATITSARLRLYLLTANPPADPAMVTKVWQAAEPWNEDTVTWNTLPDRADQADARAENSVGASAGWYEWDLTELVTDWVEEPATHPNYGVEIVGDESVQLRERIFYSKEATTELYPRLLVEYTYAPSDDTSLKATVDPLPTIVSSFSFPVSWSADDPDTSEIDCYDVRYRLNNGPWVSWQECTTKTQAVFTAPADGFYEFEARGKDNVGNVEAWADQAEASTIVDAEAPFLEPAVWLPIVISGGTP